jgi:hypothetical protein
VSEPPLDGLHRLAVPDGQARVVVPERVHRSTSQRWSSTPRPSPRPSCGRRRCGCSPTTGSDLPC